MVFRNKLEFSAKVWEENSYWISLFLRKRIGGPEIAYTTQMSKDKLTIRFRFKGDLEDCKMYLKSTSVPCQEK